MRRFFYSQSLDDTPALPQEALSRLTIGTKIELTPSIFHHWCKVLRARVGDYGILFDGFGGETLVQICSIDKKSATVVITEHFALNRETNITTMIGLVMSRGERMDYAIQKATELGVTAIWLLSSQHGEVNLKAAQVPKKLAHLQQVAIAACEQCGFNRVPLIIAPMPIEQWLEHIHHNDGSYDIISDNQLSPIAAPLYRDPYYQALNDNAASKLVLSVPKDGEPMLPNQLLDTLKQPTPYIQLLIGAEGGLSEEEITLATTKGFLPWQIGARVLRTETAPVVALATLNALLLAQDLHKSAMQ